MRWGYSEHVYPILPGLIGAFAISYSATDVWWKAICVTIYVASSLWVGIRVGEARERKRILAEMLSRANVTVTRN